MPYRYGLALYPIQFFLMFLSLDFINKRYLKISYFLTAFFIFVSASHLYFVLHFYELQNALGRTHHTGNDNLEMTLKVKKYIYSLLPELKNSEDPFTYLHGRSINKMRLKEMNWEQTTPYYGLLFSLTGHHVEFHENMITQSPQSSWLFQLHNTHEMSLKPESPFLVTELKTDSLPQNLVIKYLNARNEGLQKTDWLNTNLILPLAFLPQAQKPALVRLEFELNTQTNKFLNLLLDDNETYGYIYKTTYKLLQVKINSKVVAPIEKYKGYFLVQNQYIYRIAEKDQNVKVVVELKVENALLPNFTRVDLFTTSSSLASEELE